MIIMAVDLGLSRTGLAVCDGQELMAFPAGVIFEKNEDALIGKIIQQAKEKRAELIVVGHPINMDGTHGERAQECSRIAKIIADNSGIEVALWDERRTTASAHSALHAAGVKGKKHKNIVDTAAAVIILEGYLGYRRNSINN